MILVRGLGSFSDHCDLISLRLQILGLRLGEGVRCLAQENRNAEADTTVIHVTRILTLILSGGGCIVKLHFIQALVT